MATNVHNLIAALIPDVYCDPSKSGKVKEIISEGKKKEQERVNKLLKEGKKPEDIKVDNSFYLKAAKEAKPKSMNTIDLPATQYGNALDWKKYLKDPVEQHKIEYDSFGEALEPIYFWLHDMMGATGFIQVDKLVDNFVSTPGSSQFSEIGVKSTRMQEEAMKMLGAANQVIKSILNIIYDLKEFELRLSVYDKLKSDNKEEKEAAILSLKQVWLDTVDAKRGNSSIKGMALSQANFVTLIDAFMAVQDEALNIKGPEGNLIEIDLNDRVKRILKQRVLEFNLWMKESERELRKRFEIEKTYLKSQYSTVQIYARWIKPYLMAARQLEQNATQSAEFVNVFNTTLFELMLLGRRKYSPEDEVASGDLPKLFEDTNKKKNYSPSVICEIQFRSIPERAGQQGYGYRGKAKVTFTGYSLNDDEVKLLKELIEKDNFGDLLEQILGTTDESLAQIKEDIDYFLYAKKKEDENKKKEEQRKEEDVNPFTALFSFFTGKENKKKEEKKVKVGLESDSDIEKVLRARTILEARKWCVKFFGIYKKTHGMQDFSPVDEVF